MTLQNDLALKFYSVLPPFHSAALPISLSSRVVTFVVSDTPTWRRWGSQRSGWRASRGARQSSGTLTSSAGRGAQAGVPEAASTTVCPDGGPPRECPLTLISSRVCCFLSVVQLRLRAFCFVPSGQLCKSGPSQRVIVNEGTVARKQHTQNRPVVLFRCVDTIASIVDAACSTRVCSPPYGVYTGTLHGHPPSPTISR